MPIPKSAANTKSGAKSKTGSSSGTATPVSSADKDTSDVTIATLTGGRPDKKAHDAQQEQIKKEIDALQVKLVRMHPFVLSATISRRRREINTDNESFVERRSRKDLARNWTIWTWQRQETGTP